MVFGMSKGSLRWAGRLQVYKKWWEKRGEKTGRVTDRLIVNLLGHQGWARLRFFMLMTLWLSQHSSYDSVMFYVSGWVAFRAFVVIYSLTFLLFFFALLLLCYETSFLCVKMGTIVSIRDDHSFYDVDLGAHRISVIICSHDQGWAQSRSFGQSTILTLCISLRV